MESLAHLALIWIGTFAAVIVARATRLTPVVYYLAWIFPHSPIGFASRIPFLNRFGLRQILHFDKGQHATLLVLLVALVSALVGHHFGSHPAVGAYMAGLLIREEYFRPGSHYGSHTAYRRERGKFGELPPANLTPAPEAGEI